MNLEQYESIQSITKNLTVIFGSIAGIIGAFYNQKMMDTVLQNERKLIPKNYVHIRTWYWIKMHTREWWGFIGCTSFVLVLTFTQSWFDGKIKSQQNKLTAEIERSRDRYQQQRDSSIQATYFKQIQTLQDATKDERKETQKQNKEDIKDITDNMQENWHNYNSNNLKQHTATRNSIKKTPAFVTFIADSVIGLFVTHLNDTVHVIGRFQNSGELTAFNETDSIYFLWRIEDQIFKIEEPFSLSYGEDMGSLVERNFSTEFLPKKGFYENVTSLYFFIFGQYFSDYEHKKRREIKIGLQYNPKEKTYSLYNGRVDMLTLFKHAIIVPKIN
jgi:hypothetical protein